MITVAPDVRNRFFVNLSLTFVIYEAKLFEYRQALNQSQRIN